MTSEEIIKEFNALPLEARKEVEDFVEFLRKQYSTQPQRFSRDNFSRDEFVGMWKDHDELQDSSVWVRRLRDNEWAN